MRADVVKQYPFEFYGLRLLIYQTAQDKLVIPIQHMCEVLGLSWKNELQLIKNNPSLRESVFVVFVPVFPRNGRPADRNLACMAIEFLPYWMALLNVAGMKKGIRKKITHYQLTVREALWGAEISEILPDSLAPYSPQHDSNGSMA